MGLRRLFSSSNSNWLFQKALEVAVGQEHVGCVSLLLCEFQFILIRFFLLNIYVFFTINSSVVEVELL